MTEPNLSIEGPSKRPAVTMAWVALTLEEVNAHEAVRDKICVIAKELGFNDDFVRHASNQHVVESRRFLALFRKKYGWDWINGCWHGYWQHHKFTPTTR